MYAVTLLLEVDSGHIAEYMDAMRTQARNSLHIRRAGPIPLSRWPRHGVFLRQFPE
jgi:hypothetical protein